MEENTMAFPTTLQNYTVPFHLPPVLGFPDQGKLAGSTEVLRHAENMRSAKFLEPSAADREQMGVSTTKKMVFNFGKPQKKQFVFIEDVVYPWYDDVDDTAPLEQGDIVENCQIIIPGAEHYRDIINETKSSKEVPVETINGIVLSQSCDIRHVKVDSIILCPIWALASCGAFNNPKDTRPREELRQGKYYAYHLLNKLETSTLPSDFYLVDFHFIYSVSKVFLMETLKGKMRKRLLPPYREHLSQSFARYFMRVGLPIDIEKEKMVDYLR